MSEVGTVDRPIEFQSGRMLTHAEARAEQRLYWSRRTPAERLIAMWDLNNDMAAWRGVDLGERKTDWTVRRVPYRGR
jgi:hypothetical protein